MFGFTTAAWKPSKQMDNWTSIYIPLQENQIRLIEIAPAWSSDAAIEVKLIVVDLDKAPHYGALSYTWGILRPEHTISCNRHPIPITENLSNALHVLRGNKHPFALGSRKYPKRFWIDAICINHSDEVEKHRQIMMMPQIYFRAAQTVLVRIIWFLKFFTLCL
jgi:hypothetical protein